MPAEAQAQSAPKIRNVVWVESKLPWGFIISLDQEGRDEQSGKKLLIPRPETRVTLKGSNSSSIVGGYGMTTVDADFWEAWFAVHKNDHVIRSGTIKAQTTRERAVAQAMDEKDLRTKLEPLDPDKPGEGLTRVTNTGAIDNSAAA